MFQHSLIDMHKLLSVTSSVSDFGRGHFEGTLSSWKVSTIMAR